VRSRANRKGGVGSGEAFAMEVRHSRLMSEQAMAMRFNSMLLLSLAIGIAAFASERYLAPRMHDLAVGLSFLTVAFLIPWAVLQAVAIWKYRLRALWLLVGLPMILSLPLALIWAEWSCELGNLDACI
jgi:hypothetical protein